MASAKIPQSMILYTCNIIELIPIRDKISYLNIKLHFLRKFFDIIETAAVSYNTVRDQIVKQNLCSLPAGIKILKLLRCFRNNFYLWPEQLHGFYIKKAKNMICYSQNVVEILRA